MYNTRMRQFYQHINFVQCIVKRLMCELKKMASAQIVVDCTEDDIDSFSLMDAVKSCKKHTISTKGWKDLKDIKCLLKSRLLCGNTSDANAATFVKCKTCDDTEVRNNLFKIYDKVKDFAEKLSGTKGIVTSELNNEFPGICETLESSRQRIAEATPHVLVLGETGSGKSSFINLLLGETYFPCSILSNTHVICEIRYCEEPRAELFTTGEEHETICMYNGKEKFIADLKEHIEKTDYNLAKVYLPCEILKCGLVIVDSPGIGEKDEMKNMVLDYILSASVFIYIIDSTKAGGMLDRVQKLVQMVYKKSLEEQKICRPDSALFICNKWDDVDTKERVRVLTDTRKKIKSCWQECKDDQIICFSTLEAEFIQKEGKMAPRFEHILQSMSRLIDVGRKIVILKGYSFVCHYVDRCVMRLMTLFSQMDMSVKHRDMKYCRTQSRLSELESSIKTFFDKQKEILKETQCSIAKQLEQFVNEKDNRDAICRFTDRELPESTVWEKAAVEVRIKVYSSLQSCIKDWDEGKKLYTNLATDIQAALEKNCPKFEREIYRAENVMATSKEDEIDTGEEIELMPNFIARKIAGLGTGIKVALGIGLSPVLLVGLIVRLPVFGVQAVVKFFTHHNLEREYKAANGDREKLRLVCEKYAKKMVGDITDKLNLNAIIEENLEPLRNYLQQQQRRMLCQIDNDSKYLKRLKEEQTYDENVREVFSPLRDRSRDIQKILHDFEPDFFRG